MTQIDPKVLGARIKQIRRARGLTQAAFVSDVISSGYISLIEQGKYRPSMKALAHIASVLNMSVDDLLAGNDTPGTAEDLAHFVRAEVALKTLRIAEAKADLSLVSGPGQELPKFQLLNAALENVAGNREAANASLSELLPRLAYAQEWQLFLEAVRIFDEVSVYSNSDVNSFVLLTTLYRSLPENVDPAVRRLLMGILARRAVEIGDYDSAAMLLENKNSGPVSAEERVSMIWAASNDAATNGNLMLAKRLAEQAADILSVRDQQRLALRIKLEQIEVSATIAKPSAADLANYAISLQELIKNLYDDESMQLHAQLVLAETQLKLSRGVEAVKSAQEVMDSGKAKINELVRANLVIAGVQLLAHRESDARQALAETVELIEKSELGTAKERFIKQVARMYRDLGDAQSALELLMNLEKVKF